MHQILVYVRVLTVVQHVLYVRSEIIFGKKKINLLMSIAVCSPTCSNGGTCVHQTLVHVRALILVQHVQYVRLDILLVIMINMFLSIAVCSPVCSNGGTCSSPGTCTCPSTYTGTRCGTRMLQHNF